MAKSKNIRAATAAPDVPETSANETPEQPDAAAENHRTSGKYIYTGASLPGIKENTVITGKMPKILDAPYIRECVVPAESYTEHLKKRAITSSREAFCYRKSAEYARELNNQDRR